MASTLTEITPAVALLRLKRSLGLRDSDLTAGLNVSLRTLTRWRSGAAFPQTGARQSLNDLLELNDMLEETFDSPEARQTWMHSENRYLGGFTPAESVRAGRIDRVRLALHALESGVYI